MSTAIVGSAEQDTTLALVSLSNSLSGFPICEQFLRSTSSFTQIRTVHLNGSEPKVLGRSSFPHSDNAHISRLHAELRQVSCCTEEVCVIRNVSRAR